MRRMALFCAVFLLFGAGPANPPVSHAPIPILVYHHMRENAGWAPSTWSAKMSVSPKNFEKQMQWLNDHGYTTVTLDTYVAIMRGETAGPAKPVVITFDDNNATQFTVAFPILQKHHHIAVFYLITNRIDNKSFIVREQVKQMVDAGMDIESHTVTHATLTALSIAKLDSELTESKRVLEEITGKPIRHIAYPSTAHNKKVREHAEKAGYITGTIMDPRPATANDDLMKLPRIMMIDSTNLAKFLP